MTRKDYKALADALARGIVYGDPLSEVVVVLKNDNPRFDEVRFRNYVLQMYSIYNNERA